jgi:PAS domain S-box-containing protein
MARTQENDPEVVRPSRGTSRIGPTRLAGRIQPDALFRAVLDSAPDAIAVIDAGGRIVLANAQTERLFGYGVHELLGTPVDLLLPERLRAAHVAHRATYRACPRTRPMGAGLDLVGSRKDGTEFPVEISLSSVTTDDGMLIIALVRDVTERKAVLAREQQARREAEESLALLGTILAAVPLGIAYVGSDLRYIYLNGAFAKFSGTPAGEHLGHTARELPSARGPMVESLQRRVIETGRPVLDVAIAAETPDVLGESRQWRASGYAVSAPGGQVLGVGCVVQDVTESMRAEAEREEFLAIAERARADAERATQLLEQVQAMSEVTLAHLTLDELLPELLRRIRALLAVDAAAVLFVEEGGASLHVKAVDGLPAATVRIPIGQGFAGRVAAERAPVVVEDTDRAELLNPLLRDVGIRSLLGVPLLVDGRVLGVLHVGSRQPGHFTRDDTHLVQLVAERVALASHRGQLYEAERQAHGEAEAALRVRADAERLKDELANMVVHDLKNPVNGIAMMIQVMLRNGQGLQEAERRKLVQMNRNCREMTRLIQNLLEISKIEDGKMPVAREAVVLADLVAEVTQEYGSVAEEVGRDLAVAIGNEVAVVADHALLKRVLVNLVVNALRHSGSRDVRVEATPDAESTVTINVIDHGQGIPADEQARVFEKFHSRGGHPTADTGLGLPFCKLAVERMGGQIALRSLPGEATVFSVTLPIYAPEASQDIPSAGQGGL